MKEVKLLLGLFFVFSTTTAQANSTEVSALINKAFMKRHYEYYQLSTQKALKVYSQGRKSRKLFLEQLNVSNQNKEFYRSYMKRYPSFRPSKVKIVDGNIIMIHKGNKIKMSYENYLNNEFILNHEKIKFNLENDILIELDKFKGHYRSQGIPIIIYLEKIFSIGLIDKAIASDFTHRPHFGLALSFYNLLYTISNEQEKSFEEFVELFNSEMSIFYDDCQGAKVDVEAFKKFMKQLVPGYQNESIDSFLQFANELEKVMGIYSITDKNCSKDIEGLFSNRLRREFFGETLDKLCLNIQVLNKCIVSLRDENKFNLGREESLSGGERFISSEEINWESHGAQK